MLRRGWSTPRAARPSPDSARCREARQFLFASLLLADQLIDKKPGRAAPSAARACPTPTLVARAESLAEHLESLAEALEREAAKRLSSNATGTARYEPSKIPEAIKYPRELSLSGPWSGRSTWCPPDVCGVRGFPANGHGGPVTSLPGPGDPRPEMEPLSKEPLRRAALDARKAFVRTLSDAERALLEQSARRKSHVAVRRCGGRRRLCPARVGNQPACWRSRRPARSARIVAYPAFDHPAKPFRFRAGDPLDAGPFGMMQPKPKATGGRARPDPRSPDRDRRSRHPARPRQGPLRPRARPSEEDGARLVGVGWPLQRLDQNHSGRRLGHSARRLRLSWRTGALQPRLI